MPWSWIREQRIYLPTFVTSFLCCGSCPLPHCFDPSTGRIFNNNRTVDGSL